MMKNLRKLVAMLMCLCMLLGMTAVAEEAAVTAEVLGNEVVRLYDVGVSGIHRLLSHMDMIMSARVIVAVAGIAWPATFRYFAKWGKKEQE